MTSSASATHIVQSCKLKQYKTIEEWKKLVTSLQPDPSNLSFYCSLLTASNQTFPEADFYFFTFTTSNGINMWIVVRDNHFVRPFMFLSGDAQLFTNLSLEVEREFDEIFDHTLQHFPFLYAKPDQTCLLFCADPIAQLYVKWAARSMCNVGLEQSFGRIFYMDKCAANLDSLDKIEPPPGYFFDDVDLEKDLDIITSTYIHTELGPRDQFKAKLKHLPYSLLRESKSNKLVSFELLDPSGFLNHQYTLPEFRNRGLGSLVERDMCKKCLRLGILPHKCIEMYNVDLLKACSKSTFWKKWVDGQGQDIAFTFIQHKLVEK
uniref:Glycine N-acyltransferase-like protein n=1 Tax=Ditylenchus dipsaci TaxID=166011 RepID=A0A915E8Q3_9BILA